MSVDTATPDVEPQNQAEDILTDHSYDGIQEYDNPLPGWWTFLFWVTVVFSPVYYFYFHNGVEGRSIHDKYNAHMASVFEQKFAEIGELTADKETLLAYAYATEEEKKKFLAVGQAIYQTNCISCHKADGGGLVGPNLTDNFYKNLTDIEGIARVIENGAANGAMPAWKNRLTHPNQVVLTAAYVAQMRGKNVAGGKSAEGKEIPAWDE